MIFSIVIFFLSIIIAFAMIARKVWEIRTNKIVVGSYEESDWTDLSIESIRGRLMEILRFSVHHSVLFALKLWIIISNWFRKTDKLIHKKFSHFIHKNRHYPDGGKPSRFLKKMREHKDELAATALKGKI